MEAPVSPPAGAAAFDSWVNYLEDLGQRKPLLAIMCGALLCSWVFTHYVKLNLPVMMEERKRDWAIRRMAFFFAFVPCIIVWPQILDRKLLFHDGWYTYNATVLGLLLSALIGCASPFLYTVAFALLSRFKWFRLATSYSARKHPISVPTDPSAGRKDAP